MERFFFYAITVLSIINTSCKKDEIREKVQIPEFNFPKTVDFENKLSTYKVFQGAPKNLTPSEGFELLELSSVLFTDYALKQRLVKLPEGTQMKLLGDGTIQFPNGTILTKTFYYYNDFRNTTKGKKIIETRLLIKENDKWNAATYEWNVDQTDATLQLNGKSLQLSWVGINGSSKSTLYKIPTENQCMTCHQSNGSMTPLGPTTLNLNRIVERNGKTLNQLAHLQNLNLLNGSSTNPSPTMVDYKDKTEAISKRGRAYLAMNCAHCHNPAAWDKPAERDFDFRHETRLENTGILFGKNKIFNAVISQEMPFIGTTMIDEEGVALLIEYLESTKN